MWQMAAVERVAGHKLIEAKGKIDIAKGSAGKCYCKKKNVARKKLHRKKLVMSDQKFNCNKGSWVATKV